MMDLLVLVATVIAAVVGISLPTYALLLTIDRRLARAFRGNAQRITAMSAELDALTAQVVVSNSTIDALVAITKDSTQVEAIKAELATAQADLASANEGIAAATASLKAKTDEVAANVPVAS